MTNLLVELQTEELPPKALEKLSIAFAQGVFSSLKQANFLTEGSEYQVFGSPRRLAVYVKDVLANSPDEPFAQKLVPVRVGLDAQGNATPALLKKMQALGLDCDIAALKQVDDGKNLQLVFEGIKKGRSLQKGLQEALDSSIKNLPIPKVMTYQLQDGVSTVAFVRPVKHLVALYGEEVIPVQALGLTADRVTMGHRFHSEGRISIANADVYERTLKAAHVIPSYETRRALLRRKLQREATRLQGSVIMPEDLLDEVTALTEWPVVYTSQFEKEFLEVPEECLILTMQLNQRYFALRDQNGKLMNTFLLASQIEATDGGAAISSGNARVVRARLADAKFFYDQDRLQTLESRVEGLQHVVYHNKLGSQAQRMLRVKAMAYAIAEKLGANAQHAQRAAMLAKADLRTLMVGEFPELQGIMGEYYAKHDQEPADVALAIREHYQPRFAGDALPTTLVSLSVALADKMETLMGLFGIGQMPTGEKDPFALRRHALGVLRMLMEKGLSLKLTELVDLAWNAEKEVAGVQDHREALLQFFADRLRVMLRDMGYTSHEVDSVLAIRVSYLGELPQRLEAVKAFATLTDAEGLAAANKRITNILKKSEVTNVTEVNSALFEHVAEKEFYEALCDVEQLVQVALTQKDFAMAMQHLTKLSVPVDAFFANVMVNADDRAVRNNRLALLMKANTVMKQVADIGRLSQ